MSGISKVVYGNETLIDISNDTVKSNNLLLGNTAHGSDGEPIVGAVVTHDVIDNLNSTSSEDALSANMGKYLNDNKQGKLPNVVNDRYLHTNASTGALEWSAVQGGGDLPEYTMAEYEEEKEDIDEGTQFIITDDYMDIGSRYSTFNVTIPSTMVGDTFIVSKGSESHTVVSLSTLVIFYISGCGTYTITNTTKSQSMEFNAPYFGIYEVSFNVMDFNGWLQAGGIVKTFANLDAVLADEPTIRILMTKHDAVDYLSSWANSDTVSATKIFNDNYCAKWINLRDYALDTLYANNACKTIMDTADKYFYGEWGIVDNSTVPPTWGPLGNVPIMTSNTAPYGEISAVGNETSSSSAYLLFDGKTNTTFNCSANGYIQYKFTNPTCVRKFGYYKVGFDRVTKITISGSNDGTTFDTLKEITSFEEYGKWGYVDINNTNYYMYYRMTVNSTSSSVQSMAELQFYGRELKVSVPTMTSNTAPYGEAFESNPYEGAPAWHCFNGVETQQSVTNSSLAFGQCYIGYKFVKPVKIVNTRIKLYTEAGTFRGPCVIKIQASNDNSEWIDIASTTFTTTGEEQILNLQNENEYLYYRAQGTSNYSGSAGGNFLGLTVLQFYGLDYSEHDERHWIYDHGIEVEGITCYQGTTEQQSFKTDNQIKLVGSSNNNGTMETTNKIDLTNYSSIRALVSWVSTVTTGNFFLNVSNSKPHVSGAIAYADIVSMIPRNPFLSLVGINDSYYVVYNCTNSKSTDIKELWLE